MSVDVVNDTFNENTVTAKPLLHELQLGEQLNGCVHQSRRSDFSLMLAMLCDDVREQSQFILPKTEAIDGTSTNVAVVNNNTLRKHFDLAEQAPLALKNIEQISEYNQGDLVANNDLASLHLMNALSPKPIAFRDNDKHIPSDIISNTSIHCQKKHALNSENGVINKPLDMNAENWLKAIQASMVESNLVNVAA